jgi:NAD(P)-dependent dehydrogenase (short-subunit alcohol dehydrogenase family)
VRLGLDDRVCLVTGSTAGIGLETARLLAEEGARVVVTGRDGKRVEDARADVEAALGVACDLADPSAPGALVERVAKELGPVEVLVNNVGVAYQRSFEELEDSDWEELWQLNVMSYVRAIRAVLPSMQEAGAGAIVNVSSTAGKRPSGGMPDYSVTKAAVLSLRVACLARARRARRPGRGAERQVARRGPRRGGEGPSARPARGAGGDRRRDRVPLLRPGELRHRRGVERRRRHRPRDPLSRPSVTGS